MFIPVNRWRDFTAMLLIGDGIMAILRPQGHAAAWGVGPRWWKGFMECLEDRPALTRAIGLAQTAGGIAWALAEAQNDRKGADAQAR